jgi:hypothetical protein
MIAVSIATAFAATTGCNGSVTLAVANPFAGAVVPSGNLVINGNAYDLASKSGAGVDSVQFFLGPRDAGGQFLADATLGQPNVLPAPAAGAGFAANVSLTRIGTFSIFGYAHGVSGNTASVAIPINIQSSSNVILPPLPPPCGAGAAAPPAGGAPAPAPVVPGSAATLQLVLFNPAPVSTLPLGDMVLHGEARDIAASSGSGVDRVQAFLGDQNTGGDFLGQATPDSNGAYAITISLDSSDQGARTIYVYAHSSVTSQQKNITRSVIVVST